MITEIKSEDIEEIARRAVAYMGANPDAESEQFQAQNWQIMAAKVQESFAINKAIREVLQGKPKVNFPSPPSVYVPNMDN